MALELAKISDITELSNLLNQSYRGDIGWTKEGHLLHGDRISEKELKDIILDQNLHFLILKNNNNIISCSSIQIKNNIGYFGLFAVKVNIQEKGIGKKVLKLSEDYAKYILNLNKITMIVISQRKELIEYYLRRGYKKTKTNQEANNIGKSKIENLTIDYLEKDL